MKLPRTYGRSGYLATIAIAFSLTITLSGCNNQSITLLRWSTKSHADVSDIFIWDSVDDAYLAELRSKFKLSELTRNDKSDMDKINTLCRLMRFRWDHSNNDSGVTNDPMKIIQYELDGRKLTLLEIAYILSGYLNSIDIPARVVTLLPRDIVGVTEPDAHFIVEAFPKELRKWIMIDPFVRSVPLYKGKPINVVQFRHAIATNSKDLKIRANFTKNAFNYRRNISKYLYYFMIPVDNRHEGGAHHDRTEKSILLYPIGKPRPSYDVGKNIRDVLYTSSMQVFYSLPHRLSNESANPLKAVMDSLVWDQNSEELSPEFHWNSSEDPYLIRLRKEHSLENIVADCNTELDTLLAVMHWVHGRWEHNASNYPEKNDPAIILKKAEKGMKFACLEYSTVLSGCLNSLGFTSRVIDLLPEDIETANYSPVHVVVEVFLTEYNKWVYLDAQWDVMPTCDGIPLNAVEFQSTLLQSSPRLKLEGYSDISLDDYSAFVAEYLYYFHVFVDTRHIGTIAPDRNYNKLMLLSSRSVRPRSIQGHPLKRVHYTTVLNDFYPELN